MSFLFELLWFLDSTHLPNGGDDDHVLGASSVSTTSHSRLPTYASATASDSGEVKRLLEENRDLRAKLLEVERPSRSGGAYNRFASSQTSTQKEGGSQQSATGVNLLEPALSGQMILTVLVSLFFGFILGKIDFGLF